MPESSARVRASSAGVLFFVHEEAAAGAERENGYARAGLAEHAGGEHGLAGVGGERARGGSGGEKFVVG